MTGWIIPGDFGRLDDEGFLHVVGRSAEMFLCGGFNVYPREVENQLELLAGIEEAVVVAVPDARLGEVGLAYVTVQDGGPSEAAVLTWAGEQMASYKRPRYVRILTTMPRTHVGKTARGELAARARSGAARAALGAGVTAANGFRFSQLTEGQELWDAITISETHVVTAAGIFNDPGPNHVNHLQAEASRWGAPIAHGTLLSEL